MMKKYIFPLILSSLLISAPITSHAEGATYGSQVGHKALNGITNITTAILEIPKNIINTSNDSNLIYGITGGVVKGLINTIGRVLSGGADVVTAVIPTKPIAQPSYIWDDFDTDTTYNQAFRLQD